MNDNIFEKMTNQLRETIDSSVALALHNKNQEVQIVHLIWALLTNTNSVLNQLLNKINVNKAAIELEAKSNAGSACKATASGLAINAFHLLLSKIIVLANTSAAHFL